MSKRIQGIENAAIGKIERMSAKCLADWLIKYDYQESDPLLIALYTDTYTILQLARARVILKRKCRAYHQAACRILCR